jgi:leader peptidase (prepilin peptidase)/N-methyltransferase
LLFAIVTAIFGLMVASFLNVVIYRLPIMLQRDWRQQCQDLLAADDPAATPAESPPAEVFNLINPGSACPNCKAPVKIYQNIPIISYLILGGRCGACAAKISARYPIIEAIGGTLSGFVAWHFGYSLECAGALILLWSLIALAVIDLDTQLLPDIITLPLLWIGLCFSLAGHADGSNVFADPRSAIIGAVAGYLSLWSIYWGFKLTTGKEGMGYGDFKLLAALGAWMGWQVLLLILILSALTGLVAAIGMIIFRGHDRQIPIPFGPYLAIAGFIALIWGPDLLTAYLGASGL